MSVAIIGAGPAGLIAAERLAGAGHQVTVFDQMASPARKFLLAGRGGLNLTHGEDIDTFLSRYDQPAGALIGAVRAYPPAALQGWCEGLGQAVFRGSSGRIFPAAFKAAPLLRAWLRRLEALGVAFRPRHRWVGWDGGGALVFDTQADSIALRPRAVLLALGGASWPRMGSDGAWVPVLSGEGVVVRRLEASNCGLLVDWPAAFLARHEGQPLKRIALCCGGRTVRGEVVVTRLGLEGGAAYALSPQIRAGLEAGRPEVSIDLRPDLDPDALAVRLGAPRRARSLSNFLRQEAGLSAAAAGLVQVAMHAGNASPLAWLIKHCPVAVTGHQGLARAISSAGGVAFEELDDAFMLRRRPGVFAAGEMLEWDAPTGGYLLQACFSTGVAAAEGMHAWLTLS